MHTAIASDTRRATPLRVVRPWNWREALGYETLWRLYAFRDLLMALSAHRLRVRYKQSILGSAWAVLQPLAMTVVMTAVFSRLMRMPSEGVPYPLFMYAGVLPWTLFSTAVNNGTGSLVANGPLVTKVSFPREILPITYVVAAVVDFLLASLTLIVLLVFYSVPPTAGLLWVMPILLLIGGFSLSCSLLLAGIQVRFRDVSIALTVALQLGMFASPIFYPLAAVPAPIRRWYVLNPMAGLVDGFRRAVLGQPLDLAALGTAALVASVLLPLAFLVFKRLDATVADVL